MHDRAMLALVITCAILLFAFSAASIFGLPWLLMGRRAFEEWPERRDQQALAFALSSLFMTAALFLTLPSALASAAPQIQMFAETVLGTSARFWS